MNRTVRTALLLAFIIVISAASFGNESEVIAYPNPFSFEKSVQGGIRFLNLSGSNIVKIYSLQGKLIRELGPVARGSALWDGRNRKGEKVAPGVYYYIVYGGRDDVEVVGKLSVIK